MPLMHAQAVIFTMCFFTYFLSNNFAITYR